VALMNAARLVLTDSGGVQEETTALGVPCVTLRTTTERPITVTEGTAVLADPYDAAAIVAAARVDVVSRSRGSVESTVESTVGDTTNGTIGGSVHGTIDSTLNDPVDGTSLDRL
jgi:UDP-N-acetylglucosamine 2-epimerase